MDQRREDVGREIREFGARITTESVNQAMILRKLGLKEAEAGFIVGQSMLSVYLAIMVHVMGKVKIGGDSLQGISTKIITLIGELPSQSDMN